MRVLDLHCDALSRLDRNGELTGEVSVEKMCRGGALGQCFAIFGDWRALAENGGAYSFYCEGIKKYKNMLCRYGDRLAPALCPTEVEKNASEGKISAVLTVEGGEFLEGKLSRVEEAYREGVRMITLTWNYPNALGFPNADDPFLDSLPLTEFGSRAVETMQALGILVDLSHLNQGGFFHAASLCKKPFVCSHSCCRSLCAHRRNLTDDQLRRIGRTGSVVGLNYYSRFLRENGEISYLEDLLAHAFYIVNTAGEDALALGSDFDGRDTPLEFGDWEGVPRLMDALTKRFGASVAEKIGKGNFLRVWREAQD